ncbi:unnamed protein product [Didymodactylos carnosus]|uniref:G-protein coupled receptors family 1 profile domain-containing protein n=1 Tax=Didymodactylos carnosus TaxID=1234261 RepID=A0A814Z5Z5_9BILA|nr:unnamed protein product [Didymodactylos carnosus]CAF4001630.1 unnamed protein product [Didymodactylos carnosus]
MAVDLSLISVTLYHLCPILIVFGTLGNLINIRIFLTKELRQHSCSMYFIFESAASLLYVWLIITIRYFAEVYQMSFFVYTTQSCGFYYYSAYAIRQLCSSLYVLVSVDRYFSSSSNVRFRQFSEVKTTRYTIPIVILTAFLMYLYLPAYYKLSRTPSGTFVCSIPDSAINQFTLMFFTTLTVILTTLLLLVFNVLTLKNIRRHRHQLHVTTNNLSLHRRRDRQMIKIMLYQTFLYLCLCLPQLLVGTYASFITPLTITIAFFAKLFLFVSFLNYVCRCFVNTTVAPMYRHALFKLLNRWWKKLFCDSTLIERYFLVQQHQQRTQFTQTRINPTKRIFSATSGVQVRTIVE